MESYVFCLVFVFNVITHSIAKNDEIYSKMDGRTKGYINWLSLLQNNPTTKPDQDVPIQESDFARKTKKNARLTYWGAKDISAEKMSEQIKKQTDLQLTSQKSALPMAVSMQRLAC